MNFKEMLLLAQRGDSKMCEQILEMYKPLLLNILAREGRVSGC